MRIAQVTPYFNFPGRGRVGGVLLYVYELSRVLARRGHEVTVYTSGDSLRGSMLRVPRVALEYEEGITVRRFPSFDNLHLPSIIPRLENPIPFPSFLSSLCEECDVIHIHGHEYVISFLASLAATKNNIPTVLTMHNVGEALEEFYAIHLLRKVSNRTFFAFTINSAETVTVHTKKIPNVLRKFKPRRIKYVPLGIDLKRFENLKTGNDYVLFLGRLEEVKRPQDLIRAIPFIIRKVKAKFVIAGLGRQYKHLWHLVRKLKISKYVKFVGWIPYEKIPSLIANASVVVAPGNAGYSIIEAAAAKKPIVSARMEWNIDAIGDGSAIFIKPGNIKELADAIIKVLTDPEIAETLAERARRYVEKHASWDVVVEDIINIYEEAIKR